MRWLIVVIGITMMCAKAPERHDQYLLHPRAETPPQVESEVRPRQRKPYDFRYRIGPPERDEFRDHYRHPEHPAVRISGEEAKLTPEAARAHISGIVILEIAIDAKGRPTHWNVMKPLPFGLDHAAVEAVRTWRFKPAMDRGRPVPVIQNVTVIFRPQP